MEDFIYLFYAKNGKLRDLMTDLCMLHYDLVIL